MKNCRIVFSSVLFSILLVSSKTVYAQQASGLYVYGHEVSVFTECGYTSKKSAWVVYGTDASFEQLQKNMLKRSVSSYTPLYVEIEYKNYDGNYEDLGEFAKDYSKHIVITRIKSIETVIPKTCIQK